MQRELKLSSSRQRILPLTSAEHWAWQLPLPSSAANTLPGAGSCTLYLLLVDHKHNSLISRANRLSSMVGSRHSLGWSLVLARAATPVQASSLQGMEPALLAATVPAVEPALLAATVPVVEPALLAPTVPAVEPALPTSLGEAPVMAAVVRQLAW